jgi:hypothetical protein
MVNKRVTPNCGRGVTKFMDSWIETTLVGQRSCKDTSSDGEM